MLLFPFGAFLTHTADMLNLFLACYLAAKCGVDFMNCGVSLNSTDKAGAQTWSVDRNSSQVGSEICDFFNYVGIGCRYR